jgi:thiosulfate/3-mercaptopyruvate sulfurtransferase
MPPEKQAAFHPTINEKMVITNEEMRVLTEKQDRPIIDAREVNRYKGISEPIDHTAGHIPSAMNIPWEANFRSHGWWKDKDELRKLYQENTKGNLRPVIYCGSGVTACVNILAMNEAGIKEAVLYAGSWSDWISYPESKIEN